MEDRATCARRPRRRRLFAVPAVALAGVAIVAVPLSSPVEAGWNRLRAVLRVASGDVHYEREEWAAAHSSRS